MPLGPSMVSTVTREPRGRLSGAPMNAGRDRTTKLGPHWPQQQHSKGCWIPANCCHFANRAAQKTRE